MRAEDVRTVAVIGAGLMGHGIAQIFAQAGYDVILRDIEKTILTNATARINENLRRLSSAGLVRRDEIRRILSRVRTTLDMKEAMANCDFMIEAATENIDLKKQIFTEASSLSNQHTILATNTSGLPIAEIAAATDRPAKVVGTHFWNPPYLLRAVEIVRGPATNEETLKVTYELLAALGKKPVIVKKDVPGQIGIRILYAMLREAMSLVEMGVASPADIDTVVKEALGTRLPVLGVLELADLSGVDLVLTVSKRLFKHLNNSSEPSKFLQEMVSKGWTGVKSSKGFYDWTAETIASTINRRDEHLLKILKESAQK